MNNPFEELNTRLDSIDAKIEELGQKPEELSADEIYVTGKDLCRMFQVSLMTIGNWQRKGVLKPLKLGGRVRYRLSDVHKALTSK